MITSPSASSRAIPLLYFAEHIERHSVSQVGPDQSDTLILEQGSPLRGVSRERPYVSKHPADLGVLGQDD